MAQTDNDNDPQDKNLVTTTSVETVAAAPQTAIDTVADTLPAPDAEKPAKSGSRRKAAGFGVAILVLLAGFIAWYPLADRHAPFAGGGSMTAYVTQISPRVAGPVSEVLVRDNAEVRAGQPLFRIDDTTFRIDVEQARAQLDQVTGSVSASAAAIPAAAAQLERAELALAAAAEELDRARQMLDKGLLSPAKFSQVETNQQSSLHAVEAARAQLAQATAQAGRSDESNPSLRAARAGLEKAEFALASTTVLAPADGYITNLSLSPGQFASAGQAAMTFIDPRTQAVIADFRENQLVNVVPGLPVEIMFEAAPGRKFAGTVESIAWGIASGRTSVNGLAQSTSDTRWFPPARKIPVRIRLDDLDALPANVRLGSEAGVLILAGDGLVPALSQGLFSVAGLFSGFN